jgi:hypothetical protein
LPDHGIFSIFFLRVTRCPIYHQHTENKCEVCQKIAQVTVVPIHPKTVKKSIPYGLGVRVKRICDDKEEYEKERSKIKERLTQRGYNSNLIEKQLLKVDELDRKETLKYRKKHKNKKMDRVPLILTYKFAYL